MRLRSGIKAGFGRGYDGISPSFSDFKGYQTAVSAKAIAHLYWSWSTVLSPLLPPTHVLLLTGASVSPRHGTVLKLFYHLSQPLPYLSSTVPLPPI